MDIIMDESRSPSATCVEHPLTQDDVVRATLVSVYLEKSSGKLGTATIFLRRGGGLGLQHYRVRCDLSDDLVAQIVCLVGDRWEIRRPVG